MENNTEVVEKEVKQTNKEIKNDENEVSSFLNNHKLTRKAQFLHENGFSNNPVQLETLDGYTDVTHEDGFKGFSVYTKEGKLYIAKPETDDEDRIFSYNVIQVATTTDEQVRELRRIKDEESKFSLFKIFRIITLIVSCLAFVGIVVLFITFIISGAGVVESLVSLLELILITGISFGVTALLFRKRK